MHIEVIGEVLIAMLAVYGAFCAIQLLTELFFRSSSFTLAVFAKKGEPIENIYKRLCYAQLICARERGAVEYPIIIVQSEEDIEKLKELGARIYITKEV